MGRARRLRYRHLRRTIIAVLATVAAVLLIAIIGRMLLTAGPTRRLARNWIESVARQHGATLEIEELSWGFLPPRVMLTGVHLEGRGVRAEIESAHVDLARIRLTRQTIELGTVAADGVITASALIDALGPGGTDVEAMAALARSLREACARG